MLCDANCTYTLDYKPRKGEHMMCEVMTNIACADVLAHHGLARDIVN